MLHVDFKPLELFINSMSAMLLGLLVAGLVLWVSA
jgi:hypothetical protein